MIHHRLSMRERRYLSLYVSVGVVLRVVHVAFCALHTLREVEAIRTRTGERVAEVLRARVTRERFTAACGAGGNSRRSAA